jgi:hypothetical protein
VVLQVPPFSVYEAPADERLLDQARRLGGVLFAVTPTLNPGDLTEGDLRDALADRRTLGGSARHDQPAATSPVPAALGDLGAALEQLAVVCRPPSPASATTT